MATALGNAFGAAGFNPDEPKQNLPEHSPMKGRIFEDVKFEAKATKEGPVQFKSSAPDRKAIVLHKNFPFTPKETSVYTVEVLSDSKPMDANKGVLYCRVIEEDGKPIESQEVRRSEYTSPVEVSPDGKSVYIMDAIVELGPGGPKVPNQRDFEHFCIDKRTAEVMRFVAFQVAEGRPCLLEGDTAASKTSTIEYVASMTNHQIERLNLDGQTDVSNLIGKFMPSGGKLALDYEQAMKNKDLLDESSLTILEKAHKEKRPLTLIESQKVASSLGLEVSDWVWQDGIIPRAMKNGSWVILDELNLADASILEALNPLLEKNPSLTISSHEGEKIAVGGDIELHPHFRIFATMNPPEFTGRKPLSPAFKNRWQGYMFAESPSGADYEEMLNLWVSGEQPYFVVDEVEYQADYSNPYFDELEHIPGMKALITKLASFHTDLMNAVKKGVIGKSAKEKYTFTRRDLLHFFEVLAKRKVAVRSRDGVVVNTFASTPWPFIARALNEVYIDRISNTDDKAKITDLSAAAGITQDKWNR